MAKATLQTLLVMSFCYYQSIPSMVNGAEIAILLQQFFIIKPNDEFVNSTYPYEYTDLDTDQDDSGNYVSELDGGGSIECNDTLNANCSLDELATIDDDVDDGSNALDDHDVNTTYTMGLRRVKRQFSDTDNDKQIGLFGRMTSLPYRTLQRCFEFWFMNLFDKHRKSLAMPTHPFHAKSARKMGWFTAKLINATYRRLDQEDTY